MAVSPVIILSSSYALTTVGLLQQTSAGASSPTTEIVDYGLTAMIASSFFYLVWAMVNRRLVARDTVVDEEQRKKQLLAERDRTDLVARLLTESFKREVVQEENRKLFMQFFIDQQAAERDDNGMRRRHTDS